MNKCLVVVVAGLLLASAAITTNAADPRLPSRSSGAADERQALTNPSGGVMGPVALNEGFDNDVDVVDSGIFANGWFRQSNSDEAVPRNGWGHGVSVADLGAFNAYDGAGGAYLLALYNATQLDHGTLSEWVATPLLNFGSGATVSFYTRTSTSLYPDRLQVRVCTGGPCTDVGSGSEDVGSFTTLLLDINPGETQGTYPTDWTQYTLGAADGLPAAGTGRIAFRYYVHDSGTNGTRGNQVALDRIVATTGQGASSALGFAVTVSAADTSNPNACGGTQNLHVSVGDQVNYCYTVTNNSTETLNYQFLRDDTVGSILTAQPLPLAPAASYQTNRVVTIGQTQAPSSTWMGRIGPRDYSFATLPLPGNFIDVSDGVLLPVNADGYTDTIPFPPDFDFKLYRTAIAGFCLAHAGGLIVVDGNGEGSCSGALGREINPFLAAANVGGSLYSKMLGSAPNRQFIIEWKDIPYTTAGLVSSEIVFDEGSDVIEFRYPENYAQQSASAWIGLQQPYLDNVYSDLTPSLDNIGSIVWTPTDEAGYTATSQVTIDAGTPALRLNPDAIDAHAVSGGSAAATITVANSGNGRLDWRAETNTVPGNMPLFPHFVLPLGKRSDVSFGRRPAAGRRLATETPKIAATAPAGSGATSYMYAIDINEGPYLIKFDPAHVDDSYIIGYPSGAQMTGATFLDNDFSKFYAFDADASRLLWYDLDADNPVFNEHLVGTAAIPTDLATGMKQDPTSGTVYLSTADGQSSGLWILDPVTADVQPIGQTSDSPGIIAIAFDAEGNLYGVDIVLDALVAIDKTSGAAQPIGSLGFDANYLSGLAFDYQTNQLYFTSFDFGSGMPGLWTIDTMTGQATLISPISGIDEGTPLWDALAIAHPANTACTSPENVAWLSLDRASGVVPAGSPAALVNLAFNAAGLADGTYSANLCFFSNDPLHRHQGLPLTFTVGDTSADAIFANGFEGSAP